MTATRRLIAFWALLVALVVPAVAIPSAAQADSSDLRDRAHARVAAIMEDAVGSDIYSTSQETYVLSAILPSYVDPKNLPARLEAKTIDAFWQIVADGADLSVTQVQDRLKGGATLIRITGDSSDDVRDRIYRWLSRPVVEAQFDGRISALESIELRDDIERSVYRIMGQPGGDRDVVLVPRRD